VLPMRYSSPDYKSVDFNLGLSQNRSLEGDITLMTSHPTLETFVNRDEVRHLLIAGDDPGANTLIQIAAGVRTLEDYGRVGVPFAFLLPRNRRIRSAFCGAHAMAVGGLYISWRIRQMVLPFVRVYGQWVEERIIPMSDQLEKMANAVEKEAYDNFMSQPVGDEYSGDGSDEAESAHDIGLSFYEDISKMYQATLNLFSAGLFHVMEQHLADLTRDGAIEKEVSDTKLEVVVDWYGKNCQLDLTQFTSWSLIEELKSVANTTKHGEGPASKQLRTKCPELFVCPLLRKVFRYKARW
jgi:hypothetical protein